MAYSVNWGMPASTGLGIGSLGVTPGGYSTQGGVQGMPMTAFSMQPSLGAGFGGGAGMSAFTPGVTSPAPAFQQPAFTNSMSNWLGGSYYNLGGGAGIDWGNLPSSDTQPMMASYNPATFRFNPYSNPGRGSTAWDPQNTAWNMVFNNQISPQLATSNLNRISNFVNNTGFFGNPYAGQALASVSGAESSGNPFAVNPSSGAFGSFQWLSPARQQNALYQLGSNYSPESQAAVAMGEIGGGGYPGVFNSLNNPRLTLPQMQTSLINQYEGLAGWPKQVASDTAGAQAWARVLNPTGAVY